MSNLIKKEGFDFAFDPKGCESCKGNCCIGESGYIWISINEIQNLALQLDLSVEELKNKYLNKIGYKYSIKEVKLASNNFACCFFNLEEKNVQFMKQDQVSVGLSLFGIILKKIKKRYIKSAQL